MKNINFSDIHLPDIGVKTHLIASVWSDGNSSLITLFPDFTSEDVQDVSIVEMTLDNWKSLNRQSDLQEVEILAKDQGNIVKAIVRKTSRQIDNKIQWKVFHRDNFTCRYCGKSGIPLTVDHIDLWEEGGATIEENLLTSCAKCNRTRGNMGYEEWIYSKSYNKVSQNLPEEIQVANIEVLDILEDLKKKRVYHIKSR